MTEPPQRLGRGLAALLGGGVPQDAAHQPMPANGVSGAAGEEGGLTLVEVAAIVPNPAQPRRRFDEAALEALTASIRESGLIQPVVVRRREDGVFELIAGERRWQAAQRAGIERVPALVRDADSRGRLELALVENVVRADLNPMEVARAVAALVEDFGRTHEAVAGTLGRSRPAISNLLRLLELPEDIQEMVERGDLSEGHGRAVLMADGARARRRVAEEAVAKGLTVRQTEALARGSAPLPPSARRASEPPEIADRAMDVMYGVFEVPVRVRRAGKGTVVELRFPDEASLARALDRLT